ncbi:hypothetical protein EB795_02500 [Pseudomonas mandelii]|uniref:hypothetical protein n=1 Tax=Pseudomonas mandelii TaxID=75612 RepID=UPI0012B3B296|nr:hypothetical protein [Pseudomonas mandelii]MSU92822.1 hypothetical protein [Pseudomonas mandelii]
MTVDPLEIEDTSDWLRSPTELETCTHYLRMLENEVQELNLHLRKAREDIFGLVQMYDQAITQRDDAMSNLRERSAQLASARKELYVVEISAKGHKREADRLKGMGGPGATTQNDHLGSQNIPNSLERASQYWLLSTARSYSPRKVYNESLSYRLRNIFLLGCPWCRPDCLALTFTQQRYDRFNQPN